MCLDFLPGCWQFSSRRYVQGSKVELFARLFQEFHDHLQKQTVLSLLQKYFLLEQKNFNFGTWVSFLPFQCTTDVIQ